MKKSVSIRKDLYAETCKATGAIQETTGKKVSVSWYLETILAKHFSDKNSLLELYNLAIKQFS